MNKLDLLFGQFKWYVVGALLVVMAAMYAFYTIEVGMLQGSLEDANIKVGTLTVDNTTLRAANKKANEDIDTQNRQISLLLDKMRSMSLEASEAMGKVRAEADKWRTQYTAIINRPPPSDNDCKNVDTLLSEYRSLRISEMKEAGQ